MKHRPGRDDSGAALVLVLVVVTVIAVVVSVVLSFVDASIRTTLKTRDLAAETYAADGAAQAALNQLRLGEFPGGCTSSAGTSESFNPFYPQTASSPALSAAVRCTSDPSNTTGGGANSSPGNAILTLGTGQGGEDGIYLNSTNNNTVKVRGGIFSNSTVNLDGNKSDLENTAGSHTLVKGACSGTGQLLPAGLAVCDYANQPQSGSDRRGLDPGTVPAHGASFDPPPAPSAVGTVTPAACSTRAVYEFQPGLYTSAAALNSFTNSSGGCRDSVWHFRPGTYYFNFTDPAPAARRWTVSSGYLLGGTPRAGLALTANAARTWPSPFCVVPGSAAATTGSGVRFVFGGASRMDITKNGTSNPNVQLCASNSASGPPIAVYGLKTGVGSGALAVPAQSGCVTATPYPMTSAGSASHCPLIQTYQDPNPAFTVYGTSYAPRAVFDLNLNNNTVQVFRWGLVARAVAIRATGSVGTMTDPVIDVPDDAPAAFAPPSLIHLDVYVCPAPAPTASPPPCGTSGVPRLRAKVLVSADPPRRVSVLSWTYR